MLLAPWVVEVAPGVHLLGATFPNAAYVIETADGLALVDTCPQDDARPLLDQLKIARLDVARLRWILITHAHGDHSLGARRLRELSGARVYAGRGDCAVLRAGAPREAFFSFFDMPFEAHPTAVDVEFDGGEVLELGDARVRVIATPGHTPGSVCYLLERGGSRILFTGDVVASLTDTEPLTGPGIYTACLSPRFRGDAGQFLRSLRTLLAMPAPDLVLPGHPRADPLPQNPRVTRAGWESLLRNGIEKLETLTARHRRDGASFLDGRPKELLPGLHYWGDVDGCALYALLARPGELVLFGAPDVPDPVGFVRRCCEDADLPAMVPKAVVLTSTAPADTRGLAKFAEAAGCIVVAPRAGLDAIREMCPAATSVLASEDLPGAAWFPVDVLDVDGPEAPSVAYVVSVAGKCVVLPGRYPATITSPAGAREFRSLFGSPSSVQGYLRSLVRLERVHPDLWLPLVPYADRNANVYDDEWVRALRENRLPFR